MDWQTVISVISFIAVLAILIERSLSMIFEHPLYKRLAGDLRIKEVIALSVSFVVCYAWGYDAFAKLFSGPDSLFGYILTALAVAGGSKGSLVLFRDILGARDAAVAAPGTEVTTPPTNN